MRLIAQGRGVSTFVAFLVLPLALFLGPNRLTAQSTVSGAISGVVTDSSGAAVPGATVTVTSLATNVVSKTTANASGEYQFTALQPSKYRVTATASNFGTSNDNATVEVGQTTAVNIHLAPAGTNQTVEVTEEIAPTLQTSNADMATTLTSLQLQQVPVPGNDINALLQMAPGAVMTGDLFPAMYGQTTNSNLLISNGMEDIDPYGNSTNGGSSNLLLGLNEVQEVTISATSYTGQFGYLAGSNDTIITKSGTNAYHGNAKYFWNGRAMNANDYFNNETGTPRAFVNVNQWAASFGGPIMKDKLFFFADTEGIRLVLPTSQFAIIPSTQFEAATVENLQAHGMSASIPFYCQGLTLKDASGNSVTCPAGSSGAGIGNGIFNVYNSAAGYSRATAGNGNPTSDPEGCNGFTGLGPGVPCSLSYYSTANNFNPEWILATRFDWSPNANNHLFAHFKVDDGVQASYTDPISPIFNSQSPQKVEDGQLSWTRILGASAVNEFNMSAEHFHIVFSPPNLSATLGVFPTQLIFGDGTFSTLGGGDGGDPFILALTDYHFSDNFSKSIGKHSLKFGLDYTRYDLGNSYFTNTNGILVPSSADAFFNGGVDPSSPSTDFTTLTKAFASNTFEPIAQYHMGYYAQDEWKAKSNLTLTMALRLDHASNPVCQHACFARTTSPFDSLDHSASIPYNQAIKTGLKQSLYSLQGLEWQPRIGFAWQPFGVQKQTVIRGGVGLFYDNVPINVSINQAENSPLINTFTASSGPLAPTQSGNLFAQTAADNAAFTSGFSQGYTLAQFQANVPDFSPPQVQQAAGKMPEPLVYKWSLELQRALWHNAAITTGYVGNSTEHGWVQNGSANAYDPGFAGLPAAAPDPRFGSVTIMEDIARSSYNGFLFSFVDHLGTSIVQFNYSYAHALTDGVGTYNPRYVDNPTDPGAAHGNANFDVRQSITANYVWNIPFARFLSVVPKVITDGWQLSETFYIHTGFPFSVYDSYTNASLAGNNFASSAGGPAYGILATFNGGPVAKCSGPKNPCLTASQFVADYPTPATGFGNQELNQFRGPHYFESDLGLMKMTRFPTGNMHWAEGAKLGIGVQAYNVFNHPNFAVPDGNLDDPTFGTITSAVGSPSSIYGVLGADNSPRLVQIKAQLEF
jgi:hypothetical protein